MTAESKLHLDDDNRKSSVPNTAATATLLTAAGLIEACSSGAINEADVDAGNGVVAGVETAQAETNTSQAGTDTSQGSETEEVQQESDYDKDKVPDWQDNCPTVQNGGQEDNDEDGVGNGCDNAPHDYNPTQSDGDSDGVADVIDGCPNDPNPDQKDSDGDGNQDACDCEPNNAEVHRNALQDIACDNSDADCDGVGSNNAGEDCECAVGATASYEPEGACEPGMQECFPDGYGGSEWQTISEPVYGTDEACGDGQDNDCDDTIDENCECDEGNSEGATKDCGETKGVCGEQLGTQTCQKDANGNLTWTDCVGDTKPSADDKCDTKDNDCDGETDEDFNTDKDCDGKGACGPGVIECKTDSSTMCSTDKGGSQDKSTTEVCNGQDDNCNGTVDEDAFSVVNGAPGEAALAGTACKAEGDCGTGVYECFQTSNPNTPSNAVICSAYSKALEKDLCDIPGKDGNCNGVKDEDCGCTELKADGMLNTQSCSSPTICEGEQKCVKGQWGSCEATKLKQAEKCNGEDDNCDDKIDNLAQGTVGGVCTKPGECGNGVWTCDENENLTCLTAKPSTAEVCDNKDNDCDGLTDNGQWIIGPDGLQHAKGDPCVEPGICGGGYYDCGSTNALSCSSTAKAVLETCNGKDDDCNGFTDDNPLCACVPGTGPEVCGTDVGECETGLRTCESDGAWGPCTGATEPTPDICDYKDNDCDNETDEGFYYHYTCDGVGNCGEGNYECSADHTKVVCSTNPGSSNDQSMQELCDNKDNDCNGKVDDNIGGDSTKDVGVACTEPGECGDGITQCDGLFNTECSSGSKAQPTDKCDNKDNDCDGQTDESFNVGQSCSMPGVCGSGVNECASNGNSTVCSGAKNITPENTQQTCTDGLDNDCDGQNDAGDPDCAKFQQQSSVIELPGSPSPAFEAAAFSKEQHFNTAEASLPLSAAFVLVAIARMVRRQVGAHGYSKL